MKYLLLFVTILLTGCGTPCTSKNACVFGIGPGNTIYEAYSKYDKVTNKCDLSSYETMNKTCTSTGNDYYITQTGKNTYTVRK